MNLRTLFFLAVLVSTPVASAQEDFRVEAFGGFVHQRTDQPTDERNGWIASQTVYIRPWIGVEVELSGLYGEWDQRSGFGRPDIPNLNDDEESYFAGPRFRFFSRKGFSIGGHALFGMTSTTIESRFFTDGASFGLPSEDTINRIGGAIGPTVDVHLTDRISWRFQPDFLFRDGGRGSKSLRVATGFAFRFGGRRN